MSKYNLIDLRGKSIEEIKKDFKEFYNTSIFTWEGMNADDKNLNDIVEGLELENPTFYVYLGRQMNSAYNLKGNKRYPDTLTFISVKDYYDPMVKIQVGARWFDDIVDNNKH